MTPKKFHYSKSYSKKPAFEAFSDRHYVRDTKLTSWMDKEASSSYNAKNK